MQLRSKMVQHFDSNQIFLLASDNCELYFTEKYEPPQYGSVFFYIPRDMEDAEWFADYEKEVAKILIEHGGATYGDTVCIDFDY